MLSGRSCNEISLMERHVRFRSSGKLSGNLGKMRGATIWETSWKGVYRESFHSNALNVNKNIFYFDLKGQHLTGIIRLAWEWTLMLFCFYWDWCNSSPHFISIHFSFSNPYYFSKGQRQFACISILFQADQKGLLKL